MKISYKKKASGFTLIEMIGVLAVIAILAALLIPKIFEAINNARINNAAVTVQTVKTACADHYAKYGSLNVDGTATPPTALTTLTNYDGLLLKEAFLDKGFSVKIGDQTGTTDVELMAAVAATTAPSAAPAAFNLDNELPNNDASGSHVVVASIGGVTENDARELSMRVDGDALSIPTAGAADTIGRVKYAAPVSGVTTVYVYLTHR